MKKIRVGIIGGTGYTGVELLRLLIKHPLTELIAITSRSEAGQEACQLFPSLRKHCALKYIEPQDFVADSCDVVFCATPNGVAMQHVPNLLKAGIRVIDLSADFRIRDQLIWEKWYGMSHACPQLLADAVYGLPEINRTSIRTAQLLANPGCYPTAIQLGLMPLLKNHLIEPDSLIADAKSGASGAGRSNSQQNAMCEVNESFKAYNVSAHRHLPEIRQELELIADNPIGLTFTPHLVPMSRGILATLYVRLTNSTINNDLLQSLYEQSYNYEEFVDIMPFGSHPDTGSVRGCNTCRIAVHRPQNGRIVVVLSVIDNLLKGAAGQAIQNMNLMFGQPESTGLDQIAMIP